MFFPNIPINFQLVVQSSNHFYNLFQQFPRQNARFAQREIMQSSDAELQAPKYRRLSLRPTPFISTSLTHIIVIHT